MLLLHKLHDVIVLITLLHVVVVISTNIIKLICSAVCNVIFLLFDVSQELLGCFQPRIYCTDTALHEREWCNLCCGACEPAPSLQLSDTRKCPVTVLALGDRDVGLLSVWGWLSPQQHYGTKHDFWFNQQLPVLAE